MYSVDARGGRILARKNLDGTSARSLTDASRQERYGRWSPDGKWIAQVSGHANARRDVGVMPAEGGPERKWGQAREFFQPGPRIQNRSLSPTGQLPRTPSKLVILGGADGSRRELTAPQRGYWGDIAGAVSPDGRWLVSRLSFG